jgi:MFS family permease
MDKLGKFRVIIPALCISIVGAVLIGILGKNIGVAGAIICTTLLMSGYLTSTSILTTIIRDCVPGNKNGHFQGIRMVFIVLLPMVTGPYIGQGLSYINAQYYNDVNLGGAKTLIPNNYIFFAAAAVFALTIIPIIFLMKADKKGLIPKKVGIQPAEEETNDANA